MTNNTCPFGESLQKYWDRRYEYFSKFDEGIQIDAEGLYSVVPEQIGLQQAALIQGHTVLDGFAGVGGSAIALARSGKQIVSIEQDPNRLRMAKHNAAVYGVADKITFRQGDFLSLAPTIHADTIYLDPPWGGPAYKKHDVFTLDHFQPNGSRLLNLALQLCNEVILCAPKTFDTAQLDIFHTPYTVHNDFLQGNVISKTIVLRKSTVQ